MFAKKRNDPLSALEKTLGYAFKNRALLETALTNPSYRADHASERVMDNQRLEFLGDAVFGLLTAQQVFETYADDDEGALTVRRSHLASGRALAELARRIGLGPYLRLGRGESVSGRDKDKTLTDSMEAIFGAAWCDGGHKAAKAIFSKLLAAECVAPLDVWASNPKGRLQELAQRNAWPDSPAYELVEVSGPSHAPAYTVKAKVYGGHEGVGSGRTKRAAEVAAAQALLRHLEAADFS